MSAADLTDVMAALREAQGIKQADLDEATARKVDNIIRRLNRVVRPAAPVQLRVVG